MWRLLSILFLSSAGVSKGFEIPPETQQCIVGISEDWNSSRVVLRLYERQSEALGWQQIGPEWSGRLGRAGSAWGLGLHPVSGGARMKKEGDGRSPAGVYQLGGVWGAGSAESVRRQAGIPYHRVTSRDLWVEEGSSRYYNQFLTLDHEPQAAWEKKAQMKQNDYPQSLKMFIAHNAPPKVVPYGGSSIFFHIWRNGGAAVTAGCTTMSEERLRWMIARVDPKKMPLYVLLPRAEYVRFRPLWKLP